MRKKLDTRFPAARIKKIMQADDDVGKIAMATPVLISKALELFLQDLCDRTYEITLNRGAKTMNSRHLKECVHTHSVFDFLRETVSRVPDIGSDTGGENARRRKTSDADHDDSCDEDGKRPRGELVAPVIVTSKGRGGRGRGRGRGRGSSREKSKIGEDREEEALSSPQASDSAEDGPPFLSREPLALNEGESSEAAAAASSPKRHPKDFDLNMDLNENGEVAAVVEPVAIAGEEEEGVVASLPLLHHQDSNPLQQEEEDYDCEDED